MKKTGIITLIIILVVCIFSLLGLMIFVIMGGKNFEFHKTFSFDNAEIIKEETYDATTIKNIEILTTSSGIEIKKSEDNNIRIVQYGNNDDGREYSVSKSNDELKIKSGDAHSFCFFMCFGSGSYYELYIPESYINDIHVGTVSGDINFNNNLYLSYLKLKTISGEIESDVIISANRFVVSTTSGDINFNNITTKNHKINSVSGEIEIDNLNGEGYLKTTSGDISIDNYIITNDSNVKSVSGEVNITINKESSCEIYTKSVSGDKNIKNGTKFNQGKYDLNIETVSGDIDITKR